MKLLQLVIAAVFVGLGIILTLAVANSATTQQTAHSAELMRLYEGNRRLDVDGLGCLTLPNFDLDLACTRLVDPRLDPPEISGHALCVLCFPTLASPRALLIYPMMSLPPSQLEPS